VRIINRREEGDENVISTKRKCAERKELVGEGMSELHGSGFLRWQRL
jgi:hypothetical protein